MDREVFYIAGYDPKSYRFYYDLFKKNLKDYSHTFNIKADLSKIEKNEQFPFFKISCEGVQTKYHFLTWNDIVKKNWSENYKDALADCYSFFRILYYHRTFYQIWQRVDLSTYHRLLSFFLCVIFFTIFFGFSFWKFCFFAKLYAFFFSYHHRMFFRIFIKSFFI